MKHEKIIKTIFLCFILIVSLTIENLAFANESLSNQRREFPNTKNGIYIFYDQVPHNCNNAQLQFAANHYVGCQKITLDMVNIIRSYNNNFIVINYRLAFGTYDESNPYAYLSGTNWINDWAVVNPHTDWFITDSGSPSPGGRIKQIDWGWYLMDISGEVNGNTANGWKEYWVTTVLDQLRTTNCDGVFADSFCFPWNLDFTPVWLSPPADIVWIHHMGIFGNYVRNQFAVAPEQFYFIPNVGPWITTRDICDYGAFLDGLMVEQFASPGPWDLYEIGDWKLQMNRILDLERRDKIVICQPITEDEWAVGERMYNLANYLLIKGEKTYYNLVFSGNFYERLVFFPENKINLGSYLGEISFTIDDLYDNSSGLYIRKYENGKVFVNPTWDSRTINLDQEYFTIDTDDLFDNPQVEIGEAGVFQDSISYVSVSGSLTVGSKGGVILLYSPTRVNRSNSDLSLKRYQLLDNFPNPFNNGTNIRFFLPANHDDNEIIITIYDIGGSEVKRLTMPYLSAGEQSILWNGRDNRGHSVPSGIYFYSLKVNDKHQMIQVDSKKMIMLK